MLNLEKYFLIEEQRRTEKMAEAERYRLLKSIRRPRPSLYQRMITFVGATMVDWGCRLQSRYEPINLANFEKYVKPQEPTPCSS
ncbi:MAG: hypothetical protein P8074_01715 [Anaerolineales bacterium]|jgi:hypothetical protein